MKVAIIGGGIIGTTSAFRLKKRFPWLKINLIAAQLSPDTTSDIAAGWWEPHLDPDTPNHLVKRWAAETYNLCSSLARGEWVEELAELNKEMKGTVRRMQGMEVDCNDSFLNPSWSDIPADYRHLSEKDLKVLGLVRGNPVFGHSYLSFTWEPSKALPLFYSWLQENGVQIVKRKLESLSEIESEWDLVVNCTGLGSRDLVDDTAMFPISGHVLRVKAPWVGSVMCDSRQESWAYIIPNRDSVVLGSIDIRDNWDTIPKNKDGENIRKHCEKLCPGLEVRHVYVYSYHIILIYAFLFYTKHLDLNIYALNVLP